MRHAVRGAFLFALACAFSPPANAQPAEPDGYRMEAYRGPVPATLEGADVLDTAMARDAWSGGEAVFIDVLPHAPRPPNLPEGTIWRERPRQSIPGAIWLPNVGYGAIAPQTEAYFRNGIEAVLAGDGNRMLVFFCLAECWMSWNAARRAVRWGYPHVAWYPGGTDGWAAEGLPLEPVTPMPGMP
ncbi:PQQ-dependent catabolism-associated CXXCW motif protein [Profundibacterium mesophilum]|uniref:Rhodanese domain containing protein n=1 Tax=Profundibacterium mesophilum KAUST100406-0324 TaxID=1037889 RepID=A0A921TDU8_9RHOB|nr:PQQ-dependent catabolism-associated CXXCW motif protein [Profundibacterium mesophilum]KAF0674714.1 Rhodanese domain containing protein [Profundibacterium mesophilum KAUST100406-0324]